jgi:hypothetical protein
LMTGLSYSAKCAPNAENLDPRFLSLSGSGSKNTKVLTLPPNLRKKAVLGSRTKMSRIPNTGKKPRSFQRSSRNKQYYFFIRKFPIFVPEKDWIWIPIELKCRVLIRTGSAKR